MWIIVIIIYKAEYFETSRVYMIPKAINMT